MKGDMDAVRSLVKQHPGDVNASQPDGSTALLWAAYWNDEKAVEALLAAGANVNASNRDGFTALSQACTNGNARDGGDVAEGRSRREFLPSRRPDGIDDRRARR